MVDEAGGCYDNEDEAAMASIENEMMKTSLRTSSSSYIPSGAMPVAADGSLSSKANEFWFPDCRDCPCCNGYKYGCACMATGAVEYVHFLGQGNEEYYYEVYI